MKKSGIIDEIVGRLTALEKPKENEPKEDLTECPECGSDLYYVEEGVVYCENCKQYWEEE